MVTPLFNFTDVLGDDIENSQPLSLSSSDVLDVDNVFHRNTDISHNLTNPRPAKGTGQNGFFRSKEEVDPKYKHIFTYPYFNLVQSKVIDDALYTDKSIVVSAPTGSGKTVIFEMAIVQLLMEMDDNQWQGDFKVIYMAPVKSLCTERLTEWYPKFTKLGHLCIEVTGDTDVDFQRLEPYKIIITTPEKWDMLTRRWRDHRGLVELIKLFLIDEVHILNDDTRGPVLEAVVSRMKTIQESAQSAHRIEQLTKQYNTNSLASLNNELSHRSHERNNLPPKIRFVAVSATVSNPEDVAEWLGSKEKSAVFYKFGDESRPVKLKRVVEGYPCPDGTSIFKFDIILNYKLWPIIQKYNDGKPTLIFCNTRKSVTMTAEILSKELTVAFSPEQKAKLVALASTIKNKKLQSLILSGVGCHHAGLLYEERVNIENSFRNRELPILITTTTLAMGVNLPAHLVIIKNTQQYVNGAYQEYSISTVLQMVGRAGRPQYDTEATAVIMTTLKDKPRYQSLVGGSDPLQSYLHKRIAENLNSEAALGTVTDVAQCVQWLRSTFLYVRAGKDPRRYLGLPHNAPTHQITKKIEELCVKAMNGLATYGLITMDDASCIESTEAGKLMSVYYLDVETMKHIMKINGDETLEQLLWLICESHELSDNHLRMDERRILNSLNRNTKAATIRFPMKGKITTRQMKLNCIIQAVLGCLPIPEPSLHQEAMKIMRIAERVCKCLLAYVIRPDLTSTHPKYFSAITNAIVLNKCICSHLWENSPYVSKQLRGIGPTFSTLLVTAGKTCFRLLEESHPRDLERIMNKGPPAGNIIRKQIALLPKYHVTVTPVDANTVCFKLLLLNQAYLSENIDNLTAGVNHKSFIIIGDSNNHLLLHTSFKDKDLIGMYNGSISHEISRQIHSEHKIQYHCISTIFVGIDVQCEYVFTKEDFISYPPFEGELPETPKFIQPSIADIFKERKRKNNVDLTQSKEKKKRDCALIEKFKKLKDNFGIASKELRDELNQTTELSNTLINEFNENSSNYHFKIDKSNTIDLNEKTNNKENEPLTSHTITHSNLEIMDEEDGGDYTICDDEINDILNNIEREIHTSNTYDTKITENTVIAPEKQNERRSYKKTSSPPKVNQNLEKKRFQVPFKNRKLMTKSNYNFIDEIDHKNSNPEDKQNTSEIGKGLPESIKTHIAKYLENQAVNRYVDKTLIKMINHDDNLQNINDKYVSNLTACTEQLKVEEIGVKDEEEMKKQHKFPHTILHMDRDVNVDDDKYENEEICNTDIVKQVGQLHQPAIDFNPIEKKNVDKDITQLATQKVIALPSSPDSNITLHIPDVNNLKENTFPASGFDSKHLDTGALPEINFFEETNTRSLIPYSVKDKELLTERYTDLENCNLQIITKQEDLKLNSESSFEFKEDNPISILKVYNNTSSPVCTENKPIKNKITNFENEIVNQYSFTHTGIDVSSKNLPDRKIHVVKKVRIDLDITEVVTKPVSNYNRFNKHNNDCPAVACQRDNNYIKSQSVQINDLECIVDTSKNIEAIENTTKPLSTKLAILESPLEIYNYNLETSKNIGENQNNLVQPSVNVVTDGVKHPINEARVSKTYDEKNEYPRQCFEKDLNNDDKDQKPSIKNVHNNQGKSLIANILQKYSDVLHSKSVMNVTPDISKANIPGKELLQTQKQSSLHDKPKRCYKISDIENDRVPLPDGINQIISQYSKTPKKSVQNEVVLDKIININNKDNYPTVLNRRNIFVDIEPIGINVKQSQVKDISKADDFENSDLEVIDLKSPSLNKLQFNEFDDFKIEPAILDPKTLLLSCNEETLADIIIPPPPDFSEGLNQSSDDFHCNYPVMNKESVESDDNQSNYFDSDIKQYCSHETEIIQYSPNASFESKSFLKDNDEFLHIKVNSPIHNERAGINHKSLHKVDLTPTKDVETWILPREDSVQVPHGSVISKFSLSQNILMSQPENNCKILQGFKFRPKTKLRSNNFNPPRRANFKRKWPTVRR